ncbi:MAG: COG1361 S-layer family protein [Cellulosilyticaceae bacterium]
MKQKQMHKLMSLIMSLAMVLGCLAPFGGQVIYAAETSQLMVLSSEQSPKTTLKKGDQFDLKVQVQENTSKFDKLKEVITGTVIEVSGAASSYTKCSLTQSRTLTIEGLTYNGNGNTIDLYGSFTLDDTETVILDEKVTIDVQEKADVSSLKIDSTSVRNVVAGEVQQIILTLKNEGDVATKAGEMTLDVVNKDNTSKGIVLKKKKYEVPALEKGQSKEFPITLDIGKDVTRGVHELKVKIGSAEYTVKLKVDSNFMPASLMISAANLDGFKAGVAKEVTINVKNVGFIEAKNVKLEIEQSDKVYILDGSNVRYVDNVPSGGSTAVKIKLQISDPSAVSVPLKLNLSYIDDLGTEKKESQIIYLASEQASFNKELSISNIIDPQGTYAPNEKFTVKFTVTAPDGVKNVKLSVNGTEGIVPTSKNLFIISEMKPGAKQQYSVEMMATKDVKSSTYPIEIKAEYKLNGQDVSVVQYTTAAVHNEKADDGEDGDEEDKKKGKPKVIIGSYKSEPIVVRAGEEFDLELGFLNTSKTKTVSNLKANLSVKEQGENNTGSVFTPVGASNTFFISDLAPGQVSPQKIRLYTIPSAAPKTYELTISMEYEDENGEAITAEEHIGIPVEQVTDVQIAEVRTDMGTVGVPLSLSATLYNTGKTNVSNLMIRTEGEGFTVEDNKMFVGNFEKGASEMYQPTITPSIGGNVLGTIVLEYEDPTGKKVEVRHDFEMEVAEMPTMPEGDMGTFPEEIPMPEEEQPSKMGVILGVGLGIGLAAIITVIVLKKRKAKREEQELDED